MNLFNIYLKRLFTYICLFERQRDKGHSTQQFIPQTSTSARSGPGGIRSPELLLCFPRRWRDPQDSTQVVGPSGYSGNDWLPCLLLWAVGGWGWPAPAGQLTCMKLRELFGSGNWKGYLCYKHLVWEADNFISRKLSLFFLLKIKKINKEAHSMFWRNNRNFLLQLCPLVFMQD